VATRRPRAVASGGGAVGTGGGFVTSFPSSFRTDPARFGDSSTEESGEEGRCCGGGFLGAIIRGGAAAGVEVVAAVVSVQVGMALTAGLITSYWPRLEVSSDMLAGS